MTGNAAEAGFATGDAAELGVWLATDALATLPLEDAALRWRTAGVEALYGPTGTPSSSSDTGGMKNSGPPCNPADVIVSSSVLRGLVQDRLPE